MPLSFLLSVSFVDIIQQIQLSEPETLCSQKHNQAHPRNAF